MASDSGVGDLAEVVEFLLVWLRKKLGPQDYAELMAKVDAAKAKGAGHAVADAN